MITANSSFSVDTNILIYLHDKSDARKREIAKGILAENPKIPAQVISEYLNVTRRLLGLSKQEVLEQCAFLLNGCEIISTDHSILLAAAALIDKYNFQIFDAVIVAESIYGNCSVLYSEDMQHGLTINGLTILNPFI